MAQVDKSADDLAVMPPGAKPPQSWRPKLEVPAAEEPPAGWTLVNEAHSMCSALRKARDHCEQTAREIEQRLRELDAMLGKMPK